MNHPQNSLFSKPASDQDNLIAEQATAWFARMQSDDLSSQEKIRFQTWKSQSPAHEQAYLEVSQLWDDADFNQALSLSSLSYSPAKRREKHPLQKSWLHLSLAASVALWMVLFDPITRFQADFYTPIGGRQTVQLGDGSSVLLNTDTAITVAFQQDERHIRLIKGEAYFDVYPDATRPFVIDSGDTETRVLGTRFIVQHNKMEDKVTVLKGLVKVSNTVQAQSVFLHPDEQVSDTTSGLSAIRKLTSARDSAWLKGRLSFQDTSLAEVVKEMGRYLPGVILFSDNSLQAYRINARFDITQPAQALDTLQQTLPIKITHLSKWVTVISRR